MPSALLTGASVRIGQAMAIHLATRGYDIALHHRQSPPNETLAAITQTGQKAMSYSRDLDAIETVESLIKDVLTDFPDLEILVNSASNFILGNVEDTSLDTLTKSLHVNLMSPYILMRDFKKHVGRGLIVNLLDERIEKNLPAFAAYSVAKTGLAHLTKLAAIEWGENIRTCGIAPGLILPPVGKNDDYLKTNASKIPTGTHGSTDDLLRGLDYLIDSPFVNGEILFIDGGSHLNGL